MEERRRVPAGTSFAETLPYSRAVRVGDWIVVAGTTAALADGGAVGGSDIAEQTREVIRRIAAALGELGGSLDDVVRTRLFLTDMARFSEVGAVFAEFFAAVLPVATAIEVRALAGPSLLVEIEADAFIGA